MKFDIQVKANKMFIKWTLLS